MIRWNLDDQACQELLSLPETGMGFQWVSAQALGESRQFLVMNSEFAVDLSELELRPGTDPAHILANGLKILNALQIELQHWIIAARGPRHFVLLGGRVGDLSLQRESDVTAPQIAQPSTLVKKTKLTANRKFHRYSAFNPDRRIDPVTGSLLPGSYAAPESEVPFIRTGFAAVGRLALPNLKPASNHYVIDVASGTTVEFGTVAPAFGQAGGGVEAYFKSGGRNTQAPPAGPLQIPDE